MHKIWESGEYFHNIFWLADQNVFQGCINSSSRLSQKTTKNKSKTQQALFASVNVRVYDWMTVVNAAMTAFVTDCNKNEVCRKVSRAKKHTRKHNNAHLPFTTKTHWWSQGFWGKRKKNSVNFFFTSLCLVTSGIRVTQHFGKRKSYLQWKYGW